jgi:NADPH-dependent glutamate synthase beta subunit-like oxidoreductase
LYSEFSANKELQAALQRDIDGILRSGIDFVGNQQPWQRSDLEHLLERFAAVFVTTGQLPDKEGQEGEKRSEAFIDLAMTHPSLFFGDETSKDGLTIVEAVACGRKAAMRIEEFLG